MSLGIVFLSEVFGTGMLTLLGCGVVANVALKGTKGNSGGFLMVNFGWGIAVFAGVYVAAMSGAHLNPAVTLGLLVDGKAEFAPGVAVSAASTFTYFGGELLGAFLGAVFAWLAHKQHFDAEPLAASKLAVFSTGPAIRSYPWNLVTEIIATFVLVFVILTFGGTPSGLGPLAVALLVVASARPLAARRAMQSTPPVTSVRVSPTHFCRSRASSSDWAYSWVPIVGPLLGGTIAGLVAHSIPIMATVAK
ncbi:probable glycerol uptake facilitator protein [Arthrobacter sp. Hiyo1]|uniref:MIP/aquaporin family protein n=1 Tax=Arthrobacter sp. Hiyo1 TaxID=1588020 RepID=UPI0006A3CC0E|nr:MIP/aquaporin family protein [Arthrobacter sp. Hiyo1]GAP60006.1 probable glycerol uptake facilitator protein [Arthrobacter sp. Hiyo1]